MTAIGAENLDRETSSACLHEHPWLVTLVLRGPVLGEGVHRASGAALPDDSFIQPTAIADEIWHVAHQDRCAWSFDVELRPFGETW